MGLVGFSVIFYSEAIPWSSEENMALDADAMAVGRITSYRDDGAHRYYEISIIKWIKNPQPDQTITMRSITPKVFDPHNPYAIFQKKDLGLFYLKSVDGEWRSTNYSKQIWASELSNTIYNMKKLVGNNNSDSSISLERTCKEGYVNAVKNRTGEIFCVKPQTLQKLIQRGWAKSESIPSSVQSEYDPYNTRCSIGVIPAISEYWQSFGIWPSDKDWESLGRYLVQQKFYQELKSRNIIFEPACFGVHTGPIEESYPPRFAMCSTVMASNGTQLYLEGTVNEFDITYFNIDNKIPYQCDERHSGCLCQFK